MILQGTVISKILKFMVYLLVL